MSLDVSHKLRAFIDTNVLVAAFITQGLCVEILKRASDGEFLGFTSNYVMKELKEALDRVFGEVELKRSKQETMKLIEEVLKIKNPDEADIKVEGICKRDPSDDDILAGSFASDAEFLVTGDLDLLELKEYKEIKILRPREFIVELEKAKREAQNLQI